MNKAIRDYMNYEFPSIMETNPETIEAIMLDYFDDVKSINGLGYAGDEPSEDMMCYVQDRLINEKWEDDTTEEIKSLIENYIDENGSISQEQIDEFIWDVIGELDNSAELFEEICNNGAFGSYECEE
jgi:hypothetical protein